MIKSDTQLANTKVKLRGLEEQIQKALQRPETPERDESISALYSMARQMKEEIVRYQSSQKLRHVG